MGYGYDESDSFIDNSEAVSTRAGVGMVKQLPGGLGGHLGEHELSASRECAGLGNEDSWGNCMTGEH